jgi:hypothetical protein
VRRPFALQPQGIERFIAKCLAGFKGREQVLLMTARNDLKANVETLAAQEGKSPLEIITLLQTGAAASSNEELLEALCELKWDYIGA